MSIIEKRADKRVPARITVIYFIRNMFFSGTVLNLSKAGMFIFTSKCPPPNYIFELIMRMENNVLLIVRARVVRLWRKDGMYSGMAVKVLNSNINYLHFINRLFNYE